MHVWYLHEIILKIAANLKTQVFVCSELSNLYEHSARYTDYRIYRRSICSFIQPSTSQADRCIIDDQVIIVFCTVSLTLLSIIIIIHWSIDSW